MELDLLTTYIPPSFRGNAPVQLHCVSNSKNMFASIKKLAKFGRITFLILKKLEKEFDKFTFGNS
jgi:hypothetical protein